MCPLRSSLCRRSKVSFVCTVCQRSSLPEVGNKDTPVSLNLGITDHVSRKMNDRISGVLT